MISNYRNGGPRIAIALFALVTAGCGDPKTYDLDGGDLVIVGKGFVDQRGCAMCHQSPDPGDGTLSGQATPRPGTMAYGSNLTPDHSTGIGDWADIAIVRAMRFGLDDLDQPLCPTMPHYDGSDPEYPFMTDLEARAIVVYVRSLPPVTRKGGGIPMSLCPPIKPMPPLDMAMPIADMAALPTDLAPADGAKGD